MTHAHRSATPVSTHDTTRIDDTRIKAVRPLITPALLQEWLPPTEAALALVESSRAAISRVLHGQDDRLVVVVGPCSIHDHAQAMEYAHALKVQADALQDDLLIVMRVYFEKPRTWTAASPSTKGWSWRASCCWMCWPPACPWAPSFWTCCRRSSSATW